MSITLDLAGVSAADVGVVLSPLAELMASLHVLTESDHHPEARTFLQNVGERLSDEDRAQILWFSPLWSRLRCRLFFPFASESAASLRAELEFLAMMPLDRFVPLAAQGVLGIPEDDDTFHFGDPDRRRSFLQHCQRRSSHRFELANTLITDPDGFREAFIVFLHSCDNAFFAAHWEQVRPVLSEATLTVRGQLASQLLPEAIKSLSPTATISGDGSRVRFDKLQNVLITARLHPLIIVPSVRAWPHLTIKHDDGWPTVILFSAIERHDRAPLSIRQLSLRLAALTSPLRLEMCRHLLGEPITTSELATRLGMSASQVSHTLRQLREAGLVTSQREGPFLRHRLATEVVLALGPDTLATITR